MSLMNQVADDIKSAMKAKEREKLDALRAVKAALLLVASEKGSDGTVSDEAAIKVMTKLVKQRNEAADMYVSQDRQDLADDEIAQAKIISVYLPELMSEDEVKAAVSAVIAQVGASGPSDMGKVMGPVMGKLNGKADGKLISKIVKELLS